MWEWLDERGECPRVERCTEVQDLEENNWNIGMGRLEYRLGGDETQFTSRTKYRSWGRLFGKGSGRGVKGGCRVEVRGNPGRGGWSAAAAVVHWLWQGSFIARARQQGMCCTQIREVGRQAGVVIDSGMQPCWYGPHKAGWLAWTFTLPRLARQTSEAPHRVSGGLQWYRPQLAGCWLLTLKVDQVAREERWPSWRNGSTKTMRMTGGMSKWWADAHTPMRKTKV